MNVGPGLPSAGRHRFGSRRPRPKGQGLVEFALVLPLLLLVMLLAIDFGRVYFGWVNLQNLARVAANYAAFHPDAWGTPGDPAARATYETQVRNDATTINCALPTALPTPGFPDGNAIGGRAQVNLSCRFGIITPIIGSIVGSTVTVGASAIFPIRSGLVAIAPLPTPTPAPTPTPSPTPIATPAPCKVPQILGVHVDQAKTAWIAAGFSQGRFTEFLGNGNYTVASETPSNVDGSMQNCSTFAIAVGP